MGTLVVIAWIFFGFVLQLKEERRISWRRRSSHGQPIKLMIVHND